MQKPLVDRTTGPPRQTLFEANVQIARDRVGLRLGGSRMPFVCWSGGLSEATKLY